MAKVAGKAAPTVAVLGALAGVPQVRDFVVPSTPAVTAGHSPSAQVSDPGQVANAAIGGNSASVNSRAHLPRHRSASASPGLSTRRARATRKPGSSPHSVAPHARSTPASTATPASPGSDDSPGGTSSPATGRTSTGGRTVPSCTGTAGMLPANYAAIVDFLVAHGYTGFAAAGIAGNIYQESKGDPESVGSGGGGLIGWTPLPSGFVTGNPSADLQTQLQALLTYNQGWSQFIPALNAATSATQAADIYMNDFERPGLPVAANREAAAESVATACGI